MLLTGFEITFTDTATGRALQLTHAVEVEVKKSWNQMTDTATITLPKNLQLKGKPVEQLIKAGMEVIVKLAYLPNWNTEFEGYVVRVKPGIPVVIECEDEMWKLKQTTFTRSWESVSLKEVVRYIAPSYPIEALETNLGPFRMKKASATQVLDKLKEIYGFVSFFRGRTLVVGWPYPATYRTVRYKLQQNVAEENLEYRRKEDIKLKVEAISKKPDGKEVKATVGEDGGDTRTLHFYDLTEAELKVRAQEEMDKIRIDGYAGSITGFGLPYAEHGDVVELLDEEYLDQTGKYFIDAVKVTCGDGGYRRELELGQRAS